MISELITKDSLELTDKIDAIDTITVQGVIIEDPHIKNLKDFDHSISLYINDIKDAISDMLNEDYNAIAFAPDNDIDGYKYDTVGAIEGGSSCLILYGSITPRVANKLKVYARELWKYTQVYQDQGLASLTTYKIDHYLDQAVKPKDHQARMIMNKLNNKYEKDQKLQLKKTKQLIKLGKIRPVNELPL